MQWILNHVMAGELGDSLSKWSFKTTCYNAFSQSSYDSRPWSIKYWGYKAFLNALFRYLDNITNKLGLFFDGPPSCKSCSSRTSVVVAQLLSAPRGSPWWRSHHIQLCSGLKPKAVSPCLLWGRPAAALVVKSCLKQMVILQGEPAFFPFHFPQHLLPLDFFCCLIFQNHSSKTDSLAVYPTQAVLFPVHDLPHSLLLEGWHFNHGSGKQLPP